MKGKAQQAFFVLVVRVNNTLFNVQKHGCFFGFLIVLENLDDAFLFRDKHTIGAVACVCHDNGPLEFQIRKRAFGTHRQRRIRNRFTGDPSSAIQAGRKHTNSDKHTRQKSPHSVLLF